MPTHARLLSAGMLLLILYNDLAGGFIIWKRFSPLSKKNTRAKFEKEKKTYAYAELPEMLFMILLNWTRNVVVVESANKYLPSREKEKQYQHLQQPYSSQDIRWRKSVYKKHTNPHTVQQLIACHVVASHSSALAAPLKIGPSRKRAS